MRPLTLPVVAPVAGVSFHQEAVAAVRVGDKVTVRHQADNSEDPDACAVLSSSGDMLGYLPRAIAPRLLLSGRSPFAGEVAEVLGSEGMRGLRVRLLAPADSADAAPQKKECSTVEVLTCSGRSLGLLIGREGDLVRVSTPSGREVHYPAALVAIRDSGAGSGE